jgi:hypothetical protein
MKRFLIPALLLACGAGSARADSITQIFTHASQTVPYTYTFGANQFDPSQGTLTSVEIEVASNITGAVTVLNYNTTAESFTNATSAVPVTLTGPSGLSISTTASSPSQSGTVGADVGGVPGMVSLPGQTYTATDSTTLNSGFGDYIGTGVNTLSFTFGAGDGNYSGTASSGVFFGGSASADATITVIYNYNSIAVPEPTSFVLLGLGGVVSLVGGRVLRRRKMTV